MPVKSAALALFLIALPVLASDAPAKEFWLYFAEFSASNGQLLDPLDLVMIEPEQEHRQDNEYVNPSDAHTAPDEEVTTP